jgi:hypothetical protein
VTPAREATALLIAVNAVVCTKGTAAAASDNAILVCPLNLNFKMFKDLDSQT